MLAAVRAYNLDGHILVTNLTPPMMLPGNIPNPTCYTRKYPDDDVACVTYTWQKVHPKCSPYRSTIPDDHGAVPYNHRVPE